MYLARGFKWGTIAVLGQPRSLSFWEQMMLHRVATSSPVYRPWRLSTLSRSMKGRVQSNSTLRNLGKLLHNRDDLTQGVQWPLLPPGRTPCHGKSHRPVLRISSAVCSRAPTLRRSDAKPGILWLSTKYDLRTVEISLAGRDTERASSSAGTMVIRVPTVGDVPAGYRGTPRSHACQDKWAAHRLPPLTVNDRLFESRSCWPEGWLAT